MALALVLAAVVGYIAYRELHNNLLWGGVGAIGTYLIVRSFA